MDSRRLVLFGGPAGAGKTSLASRWCATRERAVHVQLDEVRSLIVTGLADPRSGGPIVDEQYATAVAACCDLARTFLADGYDVAIDDVLEPDAFEAHWRSHLRDTLFDIVVLLPDLEETLRRSDARPKRVRPEITRQQHEVCQTWPPEVRLDTTDLDIEASLRLARDRGLLP
jgi:predicted kinase